MVLRKTNKVNYWAGRPPSNINSSMISFPINNKDKINKNEVFYNMPKKKMYQEYMASASLCKEPKTSFQGSIKWTIVLGQLMGDIPVLGVSEKDVSKLRFTIYSGRCMYSLLSGIGQTILTVFCLLKIFVERNSTLASNTAVFFYFCNALITFMFLRIAQQWPQLVRHIAKIEDIDPTVDNTLAMKCNVTCFAIIGVGAVEHFLADLSGITITKSCQPDLSPYEAYLVQNFYWVWKYIPYNIGLGVLLKFLNIQCTFNWNYSDAFIMCVCWYLTARLDQINSRLAAVRGQSIPTSFWRTMREDYTKATSLVRKVDDVISGVIFVSFASNLLSICFLLLHVLEEGLRPTPACPMIRSRMKPVEGYVHTAYYGFSIIFIVLRSLAVSLLAARVHSASAKPAYCLYEVPSNAYCTEVQRFLEQVHGDTVTLSGLQFFSVKRGMVLTIAATIVTYELVLIQFAGVSPAVASSASQAIRLVNGTL